MLQCDSYKNCSRKYKCVNVYFLPPSLLFFLLGPSYPTRELQASFMMWGSASWFRGSDPAINLLCQETVTGYLCILLVVCVDFSWILEQVSFCGFLCLYTTATAPSILHLLSIGITYELVPIFKYYSLLLGQIS